MIIFVSFNLFYIIYYFILFYLFTTMSFKTKLSLLVLFIFDPGLELALVKLQVKIFINIYN